MKLATTAIAVIATIPYPNILGQSIGCIVPLKGKMRLNRLVRVCNRIVNSRPYDRVGISMLGAHGDVVGRCASIAFHLVPTARPISSESFAERARLLQDWVRSEFGVQEFQEKQFPSRIELCQYLRIPLSVM